METICHNFCQIDHNELISAQTQLRTNTQKLNYNKVNWRVLNQKFFYYRVSSPFLVEQIWTRYSSSLFTHSGGLRNQWAFRPVTVPAQSSRTWTAPGCAVVPSPFSAWKTCNRLRSVATSSVFDGQTQRSELPETTYVEDWTERRSENSGWTKRRSPPNRSLITATWHVYVLSCDDSSSWEYTLSSRDFRPFILPLHVV